MKLSLFSTAFAIAMLSTTGHAQTTVASARIPFAFQVGETTLPAGNYLVQDSQNVLRVTQLGGGASVFTLTMNSSRPHKTPDARIAFKRYGNTYYLADIWNAGSMDGCSLMPGKREKALAMHFPSVALADVRLVSAAP